MLNCSIGMVSEPRKKLSLPEKHLYRVWVEKKFKLKHLQTLSGKKLSIINTGQRNETEGPDFRNAMVMIDNQLLTGDIEIHIKNNDWYAHGHHEDNNYDNVVLHVIKEKSDDDYIENSSTTPIEVLKLDLLEKDIRPKQLPCETWPAVNQAAFQEIIEKYGSKRFQRKTLQARKELLKYQPEQYFFLGLLDVMGYSKNRRPMKKIAMYLNIDKLYSILNQIDETKRLIVLETLLLGTAGMLSPAYRKYYHNDSYFKGLQEQWAGVSKQYKLTEINGELFHFAGSRPANHPHKRLIGLAQIINNIYPAKPGQFCLDILFSNRQFEVILEALKQKFQLPSGMWKNHPLFKSHRSNLLIGDSRLMDFISNRLLPFARALSSILKNEKSADLCIQYNKKIPRGAMPGKIKKILKNLNIQGKEIKTNYLLQGCIEYYRLFCDLKLCNMCLLENNVEQR